MVNPELERTAWAWKEFETVPCDLCGAMDDRTVVEEEGFRMARCAQCGLVFCNPRPVRAELLRFYAQYFAPSSEDLWERQMRVPFQKEGVAFLKATMRTGRILDVGCGHGFFLDMMRSAGWETTGVEPSPVAARHAVEQLGLNVLCGIVEDAPLEPESFDAATLWYVLEHVPNPSEVLRAVARAVRRGGWAIVRVPNRNVEVDRWLARFGPVGRRFFLINPPRHLYDYTPTTLGALLEKSGFTVLRMANAVPRSAGPVLQRLRRQAWFWKSELVRVLTHGRRLTGSSIVAWARKNEQ
jgi:SAM-dependent methyltransferase